MDMDTPEPELPPEAQRLKTLLEELSCLMAYAEKQGFENARDLLKREHKKIEETFHCVMGYGYSRWPVVKILKKSKA